MWNTYRNVRLCYKDLSQREKHTCVKIQNRLSERKLGFLPCSAVLSLN